MVLGAGQKNDRTGISVKTSRALAHYAMLSHDRRNIPGEPPRPGRKPRHRLPSRLQRESGFRF